MQEQAALRQARANRFHTEDSLVSGGALLSQPTDYLGGGRQNRAEAMELSEEGQFLTRPFVALHTSSHCLCEDTS